MCGRPYSEHRLDPDPIHGTMVRNGARVLRVCPPGTAEAALKTNGLSKMLEATAEYLARAGDAPPVSIESYSVGYSGDGGSYFVYRAGTQVCGGFASSQDAWLWIERLRLSVFPRSA